MEEGSMRADANVSVRPVGSTELGTKTELKNMNSFRFLERGVEAEIARQVALVEAGERIAQETLHFDPSTGELHSLRSKEEAHDYRYLPEPDLVPVVPAREWVEEIRSTLGELPVDRRRRWMADFGISFEDAEVLSETVELGAYFEDVASRVDPKSAANWIRGELRSQLKDSGTPPWESRATPERLAELIQLVGDGQIGSSAGQEVLAEVVASGRPPAQIVDEKGLRQIQDSDALGAIVDELLAANPKEAEQLKAGKHKLIGFFVGQVMKETKGSADPKKVQELIRERTS
jgi:aspartyl-tRNA(Asn)/glutamyl-tRNA(Gln) amidotransferase subunit B